MPPSLRPGSGRLRHRQRLLAADVHVVDLGRVLPHAFVQFVIGSRRQGDPAFAIDLLVHLVPPSWSDGETVRRPTCEYLGNVLDPVGPRLYLTGGTLIEHSGGLVHEDRLGGRQGRLAFTLLTW